MTGEFTIREKSVRAQFATKVYENMEWHYNYANERKKNLQAEIDENFGEVTPDQEKLLFDLNCELVCFEKLFDFLTKL